MPWLKRFDNNKMIVFIKQKTHSSTKATEHYIPTSPSRPTIKHPVGVSINPVMKNEANMKDEYHIPEYDTIYNGVYGDREHYIPGIIFTNLVF